MPIHRLRIKHILAVSLSLMLFAAPILAQQPATPAPQRGSQLNEITFDDLLAVDAFKMYGEVRNVGQLLGNGGAGEIVEPIIKLAEPGKEFQSIIDFLKKNSEALTSSRLMFATWPTRTDLPNVLVAIEFPTKDEADKFAPKLETFLPTVLPPVPVTPEDSGETKPKTAASPSPSTTSRTAKPASSPAPSPREERLPFVITHAGTLVFIADKAFKFEKLHPQAAQSLFRDPNFRSVHDKFSSEPIFFFFNVALEDKTKPQPAPTPAISEVEVAPIKPQDKDDSPAEPPRADSSPEPTPQEMQTAQTAVLIAGPEPSPAPTPTKEQEAQATASMNMGRLLDAIGYGEPQWPEAVGLAIELSGSEYVVRALMIDKPDAKRTPIPFVPQLLSGSPYATEAASVLPDDTDVFVSASIDLTKTYEGMKKEAETRARANLPLLARMGQDGTLIAQRSTEPEPDAFAEFETKAGFKIKDDLLPALGNEVAVAGSLKTLMGAGFGSLGIRTDSASANESSSDKSKEEKKPEPAIPVLLIEVRDRDAVRKLMPKVLTGLGIGEANLTAQTERHGDAEMVNYAGVFAYGFVGNFLVISDATSVRKVIDANVNSQTLSSNTVFRNSRRWESNRTLGQLYVSPALMQSYHDQIRKQAASMDQAMRDFLLALDPRSEAITYALSNDGPGMQHELHLPKNLILTMVAGISSAVKNPPPEANEGIAIGMLGFIANSEAQYKAGPGKGSYGSLQEMIDAKMFPPDVLERYGYNFQVTVNGDQFEAVATPREYGKTGTRSFFIDKSSTVRGGDHGGGAATIADPVIQP